MQPISHRDSVQNKITQNSLDSEELEAIREEARMQKQLRDLEEEKEVLSLGLSDSQAKFNELQQTLRLCQQHNLRLSLSIKELEEKGERFKKDKQYRSKELSYLCSATDEYNTQLNWFKAKYLLITNEIDLDPEENPNSGKRCKFYPNPADNAYSKFSFQEHEGGYLVTKVSNEIGFTKICNQIAFPTEGKFLYQFEVMQVEDNELILGLLSKDSPDEPSSSNRILSFNFRNQAVEYKGVEVEQLECALAARSRVDLSIDMSAKTAACSVDDNCCQTVSFSALELARQSLYLFLALSSGTVVSFSNC